MNAEPIDSTGDHMRQVRLPARLYKYCSLSKERLEYVVDVVLNERLYCSAYHELNDPFEGLFVTTTTLTIQDFLRVGKLPPMFAKFPVTLKSVKEIRDLLGGTDDKIKICSLSSSLNDVRLWSYYADGHKGIVLEIDPSGLDTIHEVTYSEELPMGMAGGITLLGQITPREVLCRKTDHWEFEKEYRIIDDPKNLGEHKYCDVKGRINAIYLGTRTSEIHRDLLTRIVPVEIPIWTTKINHAPVTVAADQCISRAK